MSDIDTVVVQRQDGIATITLNRPAARNALDPRMADALREALTAVQADSAVGAVVLHGAGGAFCAGGDMRATHEAGPRRAEDLEAGFERFRRLVLTLHEFPKPLVSAVEGAAFGAGFSLLLHSDIVLLAPSARLCMAFQRVGLVPDCGAMYLLPRIVGLQRARELLLSGREIDPAEAVRLGLAMEVLPADALMARARQLAGTFLEASPTAVRLTKRGLQLSQASDLSGMLSFEAAAQSVALGSDYLADAAGRFSAKVPLRFQWPPTAGRGRSGPG